jgi:hypothetical protein
MGNCESSRYNGSRITEGGIVKPLFFMRKRCVIKRAGFWGFILVLVLSACGNDPANEINQGAELFTVTFGNSSDWEEGTFPYPADAAEPASDSTLAIHNGHFLVEHQALRSSSFAWTVGGEAYENVIIDVEAAQISSENDNLYGVGCRLEVNDNGDVSGYALLVSGDGHYGLARISSRSLTFILDWHQSDTINPGRASNTLRAVCIDDYLALYVNGDFMGDVTDNTYRRAGQAGFIAGVTKGGEVSITFDDLSVYEGSLK